MMPAARATAIQWMVWLVEPGAYYLAQAFKKWGVSWDAVGAYNAGFKKTPRQAARRYEYAKKIHYYYTAIKASKRTSSKDQKIAMN